MTFQLPPPHRSGTDRSPSSLPPHGSQGKRSVSKKIAKALTPSWVTSLSTHFQDSPFIYLFSLSVFLAKRVMIFEVNRIHANSGDNDFINGFYKLYMNQSISFYPLLRLFFFFNKNDKIAKGTERTEEKYVRAFCYEVGKYLIIQCLRALI